MANVLKGLTRQYENLPGKVLDEAIAAFTHIAERRGGRMMGRYQLTAEPRARGVGVETARVLMVGTPAGFWVWRETGIGRHTIAPKRRRRKGWKKGPLGDGLALHPVWEPVIHPGVAGKQVWTAVCEEADRKIRDLVETANGKVAG